MCSSCLRRGPSSRPRSAARNGKSVGTRKQRRPEKNWTRSIKEMRMRGFKLASVVAVVFLCGLSGCMPKDKRGQLIREMIDSVNETADLLAQVKDADSAERYK